MPDGRTDGTEGTAGATDRGSAAGTTTAHGDQGPPVEALALVARYGYPAALVLALVTLWFWRGDPLSPGPAARTFGAATALTLLLQAGVLLRHAGEVTVLVPLGNSISRVDTVGWSYLMAAVNVVLAALFLSDPVLA